METKQYKMNELPALDLFNGMFPYELPDKEQALLALAFKNRFSATLLVMECMALDRRRHVKLWVLNRLDVYTGMPHRFEHHLQSVEFEGMRSFCEGFAQAVELRKLLPNTSEAL